MVFSDTTNKNGLIQGCEDLCGFSDAGITGVAYNFARFTAYLNQAYGLVINWIFKVDGQWHFDDSNYTDFPISTTTLVADQRDYTLPATLLNIRQVEVLDIDGKYRTLELLAENDERRKSDNQQEDAGKPTHYYLQGNSVFIYPKTNSTFSTLTAGLRLTYDRYVDYFTVADTTQAPGFCNHLHQILYKLACLDYLNKNDMDRYNRTYNEIYAPVTGLKAQLESYYQSRNGDERKIMRSSLRRSMFI